MGTQYRSAAELLSFFRSRRKQAIVELALRQQLAPYAQARPRPRLTSLDRAFWVALFRLWPGWKEVLVVVKPETVVRWHRQRWLTFLRNHKDAIAAMDFCVVPTVSFQLLYVWFVIDHGRQRLLHFNVTTNPSARWVIQQLREAFPSDRTPRYLLLDRDSIFSTDVTAAIKSFGIDPVRSACRSP